jgi:hypothetical protein
VPFRHLRGDRFSAVKTPGRGISKIAIEQRGSALRILQKIAATNRAGGDNCGAGEVHLPPVSVGRAEQILTLKKGQVKPG